MTSSLWNSQTQAQFNGLNYRPAGLVVAVDGTAYPGAPNAPVPITNDGTGTWSGFASGMVGGLENIQDGLWNSVCIGYEASTVPMWPSVQQARGYSVAAIQNYTAWYLDQYGVYPPTVLAGYSQGTMATDQMWVYDILTPPGGTDSAGNPTGRLHYLLPYVYRSYQYGHVFRMPGVAHGNDLAGLSESIITDGVQSGGIGATLDLTEAQTNYVAPDGKPVVYSCANPGDIYTAAPTGTNPWTDIAHQGKTGEIFFKIIMDPTFVDVIEAAEVLGHPFDSIEEGYNAAKFFAEGMAAPHYEYFPQLDACIGDLLALGNFLPHSGC